MLQLVKHVLQLHLHRKYFAHFKLFRISATSTKISLLRDFRYLHRQYGFIPDIRFVCFFNFISFFHTVFFYFISFFNFIGRTANHVQACYASQFSGAIDNRVLSYIEIGNGNRYEQTFTALKYGGGQSRGRV